MKLVQTESTCPRFAIALIALVIQLWIPTQSKADTVVEIQVRLGENIGLVKLELYEDIAPTAVSRFLENVRDRRYQFTILHHIEGATVRGGLFTFNDCFRGPEPVAHGSAIAAIENGLVNETGTVALVRNPDNPLELTDEWMISLASNPFIRDELNPPIVIGKVIEGLDLLFDIDRFANRVSLPPLPPFEFQVPTWDYPLEFVVCGPFEERNVIKVAMEVESVDKIVAINSYDVSSNQLLIKVDAGTAGLLSLAFQIISTEPEGVMQAVPETVVPLAEEVPTMASFDENSGQLFIPQIYIGAELAYRNVIFSLTDAENLLFTLLSFELP